MTSFFSGSLFDPVSWREISALSSYFAMLGSGIVCLPIIYLVGRNEGLVKLFTLIWGMLIGLSFTSIWFEWTNTGVVAWIAPTAAEIAYLYLAFFIAEATKISLSHMDIAALPYTFAADGVFGTVAVLIIHVGYDPSFASLLLGPFFLIAIAAAILSVEWVFVRPLTIVLCSFGLTFSDPDLDRRLVASGDKVAPRFRLLRRELLRHMNDIRRLRYPKRVRMIDRTIAKAIRAAPRHGLRTLSRQLNWPIMWGICAFNIGFLLIMTMLTRALI